MYRGSSRSKILPIIMVLVVVVIGIVALVSVGRAIFGGGGDKPAVQDTSRDALLSTAIDHSVRMTVRGKIVADENFRSYQITISPTDRTLTTYSGYLEQLIDTQQLGNNSVAYEEFVHALDRTNFIAAPAFSGDKDDTRGVCATGSVYEFEVMQGGEVVKRLWSSTCKGIPGSLKAKTTTLSNLFLAQMPDNATLLKKIKL